MLALELARAFLLLVTSGIRTLSSTHLIRVMRFPREASPVQLREAYLCLPCFLARSSLGAS